MRRKAPSPQIDITEWIAAIAEAESSTASPVRGVSAEELAAAMGCSIALARKRLSVEIGVGRWSCVGSKEGTTTDGRRCHTPLYAPNTSKETKP